MNDTSLEVRAAVESGQPQVLEALRGKIDWKDLVDGNEYLGQMLITACYATDNEEGNRAAVLLLMRLAIEDGCTQLFETWEVDQGATGYVAPVLDFIEGDFPEALVMFMDQGFDPLQGMGIDGLSALEIAQEKDQTRIESTIRSYLARAKAHSALDDILQEAGDKVSRAKP